MAWDFARIQFTPDLLLADEVNRTPPKTRVALLEPMAEGAVSADGHTMPLPDLFIVLATDNLVECEGTYQVARGSARPLHPGDPAGLSRRGR